MDSLLGGERGIRTPGGFHLNSFQDCRNRPLCHLSGRKIKVSDGTTKTFCGNLRNFAQIPWILKHLRAVNKYFWKYRWRFLLGILFIVLSNYFRILSPQVTGYIVNSVEKELRDSLSRKTVAESIAHPDQQQPGAAAATASAGRRQDRQDKKDTANYDILVKKFIRGMDASHPSFGHKVAICGITLLLLAILGGFFMFLMRQTIIVMSRHIEYDQKAEIYAHYQQLDANFYKTHSTGDLLSRMAEDVSRVRMFTGPAVMYRANPLATIGFSLFFMLRKV